MKKKFISAMLFGALLAVPATMFVSCKDYDDDITEVRGEITTSATDLSSLVEEKMKNVKTEISALNGQLTALEEASDAAQKALSQAVTDATNDAKGYADIQAAQAKQASIDAARALVENAVTKLEGSMAAAQLIIDGQGEKITQLLSDVNNLQTKAEQAAAIATAQGEKISALQAADAALQEGITAAQSRADQAYALAEQAKAAASEEAAAVLEKVTKNLETVKTELAAQTNIVSEKAAEALKKAEDNAAAIEKQEAAVQTLKETNETILKQLGESAAELKGLIEGNTVKIKETDAKIEVAKVEAASALLQAQTELKALIEAQKAEILKDMATKSDLAGLQGDMTQLSQDIADLVRRLNAIDGSKGDIETINGEIASINTELAKKAGTEYVDGKVSSLTSDINSIKDALAALGDPTGESTDLTEFVQKIQQIENKVNAAAKAADVYTKTQVDQKLQSIGNQITAIEKVLNGEGETKGLVARLGELETKVTNINLDIAKLNMALYNAIINDNVAKLITSIIYQDAENFQNVYAQVVNTGGNLVNPAETDVTKQKVFFPYMATGFTHAELPVGKYNVQKYSGRIYVTVNPTDIEADGVPFKLVDSKDNAHSMYAISEINPADVLITRATSANGLWAMTLEAQNTILAAAPATANRVGYAVAATYEQAVVDFNEDGTVKDEPKIIEKSIYSHYDVVKNPVAATAAAAADLTLVAPAADAAPTSGALIQYSKQTSKLSLGTTDKKVYKKFIECIDVKNGSNVSVAGAADAFNEANADLKVILDADNYGKDDQIDITCPTPYMNYKVTLKYYIWNYDGTIVTKDQVVVFNKLLWENATTTNTFEAANAGTHNFYAEGFDAFDFINGVKGTNNTLWKDEAAKVQLTLNTPADVTALTGLTLQLQNADKTATLENVAVTAAPVAMTNATLDQIKHMKVSVPVANLVPNTNYNATLTFFDRNNYRINVVNIAIKMTLPTAVPSPFRIPAAFSKDDTYGWAGWDGTNATYNLAGSIYNPTDGFTVNGYVQEYKFKVGNDFTTTANAPYAIAAPTLSGNFVVSAPAKAVQDEYVYNMTTGINYYGLTNGTVWNWNNTTTNVFNLTLLSPVKYSVLGRGEMPAAKITNQGAMKVLYGNGNKLDIVSSMITATNPNTTTPISYLDGRDAALVTDAILKYTDATDGNNALLTYARKADGSYTLTSSETVSLQGPTKVKFTLDIIDVWGITTPFNFYVTVTPNY